MARWGTDDAHHELPWDGKTFGRLKGRWPAHSVPPHMWQELETLEEELEQAKREARDNAG